MIASSSISIGNANTSNHGTVLQATNANNVIKKRKNVADSNNLSTIRSDSGISLSAEEISSPQAFNSSSSVNIALQQQQQQPQPQDSIMFWQWNIERIEVWMRSTAALFAHQQEFPATTDAVSVSDEHNVWVSNMVQALRSACGRQQQEGNQGKVDEFHILDSTFSRGHNVVFTPGSVVSRLNVGGWINGLSGVQGGLVDAAITSLTTNTSKKVPKRLEKLAHALHRATCAKLEIDMLESTPLRIVELLCPEVSMQEITNIRRRIYDTVVLGKGMQQLQQQHQQLQDKLVEEEGEDLLVAALKPSSEVEKWHRCKNCNNNDQAKFTSDTKNGDIICTECGTVVSESLMHEGSQFRKFEGEVDRNHHGDAPNYLYSNAHNLSTTLGAGIGQATSFQQSTTSTGMMGGSKKLENILRNAHAYTEMNISQFGKDERKTRVGYKDRQKKDAFSKMTHVGDALNLHDAVVQRSKELFAGFRDDRELVQQFRGVVAACLCEAFDQLSRDGRRILKVRAGDTDISNSSAEEWNGSRALWRNAMHNTTAASKGTAMFGSSSLLVHTNNIVSASSGTITDEEKTSSPVASTAAAASDESDVEKKPAATWDMDDVRAWLLQASRSIARQWVNAARNTTSNDGGSDMSIPTGSLDELEGKLVKYTFLLCDELEKEEKSGTKVDGMSNKQRVHTPRVSDIEKLGIKWQSSHERGATASAASTSARTAGQRLILKTTKKLSSIIQDGLAGEAFHKELRHLLARQEERNKQDRMNENAQKRFQQMQRKPWIKRRLE